MVVFTDSEIAAFREETPGRRNVVHFNYAGAGLMSQPVIDATIEHIRLEGEIGGYEAADAAEARVEGVYDSIARLLHANRDEIAVVENATRAWDMAFYAIPFHPGDRILTSVSEYASNVIAFLQIAQRGVTVEVVPNDEQGQLSVSALREMIDDRVRLIAVSHVPTNGGLVQPAAEIGKVAKEAGALFLLDACQSAGQMPLDVVAIGCDILSATSRKYLRGPRGVGFLYVRQEIIPALVPPMLDLHAATWITRDRYEIRNDARRFENWEANIAGKLGLGVAVDYALSLGLDRIWATVSERAASLRNRLASIPGVTVRDLGQVQCGIVTFTVDGVESDEIVAELTRAKINTVSSSVFSTRYDMESRRQTKFVRASVHYLTTEAEIDLLAGQVERLASA